MAKKYDDFLEEPEEKSEDKTEYTPKENPIVEKNPFKILNKIGGEFVLMDKYGNGIRKAIPVEYNNAKIGDTIYL